MPAPRLQSSDVFEILIREKELLRENELLSRENELLQCLNKVLRAGFNEAVRQRDEFCNLLFATQAELQNLRNSQPTRRVSASQPKQPEENNQKRKRAQSLPSASSKQLHEMKELQSRVLPLPLAPQPQQSNRSQEPQKWVPDLPPLSPPRLSFFKGFQNPVSSIIKLEPHHSAGQREEVRNHSHMPPTSIPYKRPESSVTTPTSKKAERGPPSRSWTPSLPSIKQEEE
ncbi:hypothetical protein BU16DRAFT_555607 [Lophium mytilinum]|uniref:Uncharacterized protein n=1 Tax=Lophium mytilinum TaxID=390894 RepID=A0A6A6R9L8_9PEZI|nr:hypothetical protein BU16DRAFT_555607 [Lophium mytilinum]